jgi:ketosteroid isomerase-like protein
MKNSTLAAVAVSALASGLVCAGTHETKSHAGAQAAAKSLPEVIISATRVRHAVEGYVDAISAHDGQSLSKVFTDDAVVEFVNDDPGASLSVHADSLLDDGVEGSHLAGTRSRVTNVHVFPTSDGNTVFVQYDIVADSSERASDTLDQLALIHMRGDKIEKMVNFNAPPASLARGSACATPGNVVVTRR